MATPRDAFAHRNGGGLAGLCRSLAYRNRQLLWLATVWTCVWLPWWFGYRRKAYARAFPFGRMALVLGMFAVPSWSALMLVLMWRARRQARTGASKPIPNEESYALISQGDEGVEAGIGPSRHPSSNAIRVSHRAVLLHAASLLAGVILYLSRHPSDVAHHAVLVDKAAHAPRRQGYWTGERVFIAALFYNNEAILPQWMREMSKVIRVLGPDNVFVSIMESWSTDDTAKQLLEYQRLLSDLGVAHRVLVRHDTIARPYPFLTDRARIDFLAASRNVPLEPLLEEETGAFGRVLYSNDVLISAEAILELLSTRSGDYDMACGLDFSPWGVCDGWVMRDRLGGFFSALWPHIIEPAGMEAVSASDPAKVLSCWNGIAALRADPFLQPHRRNNRTLTATPIVGPPASHPSYQSGQKPVPRDQPPLRFRGSAPLECFSSECLLLPYDMRVLYGLDSIWINPRVLVAYTWDNYMLWTRTMRHWLVRWWIERWERGSGMHDAVWIEGRAEDVWTWEGGACQVFNGYSKPQAP